MSVVIPVVVQWALAGVAAIAVLYFGFVIAVRWRRSSVDSHIVAQWTEGRLRLDSLLALLRKMAAALEQEVEKLRHLDPAATSAESENLQKVASTLRRFTFEKHLREESRALVALLQFCARDIMESQGRDMTLKLSVLAEIQAALDSAERV